jgi:hypothetical protein
MMHVVVEDPFRGLLDPSTATILADACDAKEVESLVVTDVHNLMACACNTHLPDAVRGSAMQRLTAAAHNPAFLAAITVQSFLEEALQCAEAALAKSQHNTHDPAAADAPVPPRSHLCIASLYMLGSLCCRSAGVLVCSPKSALHAA